jgi:hypothetical protein
MILMMLTLVVWSLLYAESAAVEEGMGTDMDMVMVIRAATEEWVEVAEATLEVRVEVSRALSLALSIFLM